MPDLFISYSRRDGDFVRRLHGALTGRGRDVWVDWEDIPPSWEWRGELQAGLEESHALVFVISPDSLVSRECAVELERALEGGKRILPVMLRNPDDIEVPPPLAERNWIFFRDGEDDFDASVAALERALDTDAAWVRDHTRLLARASEWGRRGRDPSLLLRGNDLRQAEQELSAWREGKEPVPTGLQREYVAAGRRAAGRRTAMLGAAAGVALLISVAFGAFAVLERNRAIDREREAKARGLAAAAAVQADGDPQLAALLAVESVLRERTPEGEESLRRVVGRLHGRGTLPGPRGGVVTVDLRGPGRVVTASRDGRVRVWSAETGRAGVLARHPGGATSALVVPGGRRLITAGDDGTVRVFDARTSRRLRLLRAPGPVYAGTSDDGRNVVALDGRGDARIWDIATGRRRAVLRGSGTVWVNVDRSADRAVLVQRDGRIRAFDVDSGRPLATWRGARSRFTRAGMGPDGSFAVVVSPESAVAEVRDLETGRVRHRLTGHRAGLLDTAVSLDGRRIATGSYDNTVRVWDARTGDELHALRGHGDSTTQVTFSHDGRRLISASPDETVRVWASATGQPLATLRPGGEVVDLAVSPDARHVATAGADGSTRVWEAAPGRTLALLRHRGAVEAATLDPSGRYVASSGPDRVQFAEAATGRIVSRERASLLGPDPTHDMAFGPRGRWWAIGDGYDAYLFRLADGRFWGVRHAGWVNSVAWDRPGRRLATASFDGTARVIAPPDRELARFEHRGRTVYRARFTRDGARLVTLTDDGAVHVWRISDRRELDGLPPAGGGGDMDLAPDGRTVAANDGGTGVRLWRIGTAPGTARRLDHKGYVNAVRFSRDGRRLATASDDGTVDVWNVRTGRRAALLRGHLDRVRDVDWSPDGRFLVSGGDDRTVRLWDLSAHRAAAVFEGHDAPVRHVRFSRDARGILAVPERGAVAVYACDACLPLGELVRRVRDLAGRRLTPAERERYLR